MLQRRQRKSKHNYSEREEHPLTSRVTEQKLDVIYDFNSFLSCLGLRQEISASSYLIPEKVRKRRKRKPEYQSEYEILKKKITHKHVSTVTA